MSRTAATSASHWIRPFAVASLLAIVSATALPACGGGSSNNTTTPTVTVGPQTQLFEGQLDVGGSAFYSFTVQATGNANVMLASVATSNAPGTSSTVPLGLAVGAPLGTDCTITQAVVATAALQSPLVANLTPGIYCVRVYDVGALPTRVNFAVRIVHT